MWDNWQEKRLKRKKETIKRRRQKEKDKKALAELRAADNKEIASLKREKRMNTARYRANKEPWTYTKYLVAFIVFAWFGAFVFCIIYWAKTQIWENDIMSTVSTIAVPTILSYAVKSGFEYRTRYNVQAGSTTVTNADENTTL